MHIAGRTLVGTLLCLSVVVDTSARWRHRSDGDAVPPRAAIEGTVKDAIGQPLPGSSVVAIPERGGPAAHAVTDRDGAYHLVALPQATYRVDVTLAGFVGWRQNHVTVGSTRSARVDAMLSVGPVCECVSSGVPPGPNRIRGQVVDEAGHPLPHARLEFVGPRGRETMHADHEGRFVVTPPARGGWSIGASDSGFASATQSISSATTATLVFRLRFGGTRDLPDTERFPRHCSCPEYLGADH